MAQLLKAQDYLATCEIEDCSVRKAAAHAGISQYHFQRLFREAFSTTPYEVISARRISEAKTLLLQTSHEVMEIALDCGFTNASSFARAFRRATGLTPSQYRAAI